MDENQKLEEAKKIMNAFQQQMSSSGQPSQSTQFQNSSRGGTNEFDNQGGDFAGYGDGNSIGMGFDNQGNTQKKHMINNPRPHVMNNPPQQQVVTNQGPVTMQSPPGGGPMPSMRADVCPQCKTMHPPLKSGEKCPNVGIGEDGTKHNIDDATINQHLVNMRNIIISNMSSKNIKDGSKFFQYAVIELTKALENYTE